MRRHFYRDHYAYVRTLHNGDANVTMLEGIAVNEIRRTDKAVLLSANGKTSWFPMRALEAIEDPVYGHWRIASWFRSNLDADKQQLLKPTA
jgi:hypothetical protein